MDLQDSCSMTPPLSPPPLNVAVDEFPPLDASIPMEEEDQEPGVGMVFICGGESQDTTRQMSFHHLGPLSSGSLHRHMGELQSTSNQGFLYSPVLFGYSFCLHSSMTQDIHRLFQFARQWIDQIEMFSGSCLTKDQSDSLLIKRKELKEFFDCLDIFIWRYTKPDESSSLYREITQLVQGLMLHVGRLSEHKFSVGRLSSGPLSQSKAYHLYHMHLDVYWGALQIATRINHVTSGGCFQVMLCCNRLEENLVRDFSSQLVQLILWDVVALSSDRYTQSAPFPCSCVQELLVIIIQLMSWRHKNGLGEDFWTAFNTVLDGVVKMSTLPDQFLENNIDCDIFYNPPPMNVENPSALGLWLLVHVAPLFTISDQGKYDTQKILVSNYPVAQGLLKSCLSPNLDESRLQHLLKCCVKLSHLWEPSVTIAMTLWDYFCSKLNNNFHVAALGMDGLASIRKTPASFLEGCKSLIERDVVVGHLDQENSFSLFLHILSHHLSQFIQRGSSGEWRQLKGRIFSKFHQRRMQELRENGLNNLTKMFITLLLVIQSDFDTIAGKLCDLYDLLDWSSLEFKSRQVIWKGMFSLCIIYLDKKQDIGFLAKKLSESFNSVCSEYCQQYMDSMSKQKLWSLLSTYLDSLSDVLDHSPQHNLSQHHLFGDGLTQLLPACRESELHHFLSTAVNILTQHRSQCANMESSNVSGTRELVNKMWQIFYPFCKSHCTTQTPPREMADLVASLTLSVAHLGEDPASVCASFKHFTLREDVNINLTCRYLDHLLDSSPVTEALSTGIPDYSTKLINIWFRCSLLIPDTQKLSHLNRFMLRLPEVHSMFVKAELESPAVMETALLQFFKALAQSYHKVEGLKNKITLRNTVCSYFREVIRFVSPVLRNYAPLETLSCTYKIIGQLIKFCSPMLYVKSQPDCPLPGIIDRLILPHSLFDVNKQINQNLLTVLKEHLHLYIQGLSQLDYKRDPYIQRRLRDIVVQFLQRIPIKSTTATGLGTTQSLHPLVAGLGKSLTKSPSEESSNFRQHVLSIVVENYLKPTSPALGLSFITEVFRRTACAQEIARDAVTLLEVFLELTLLVESQMIKQHVTKLQQIVLESCVKQNTDQFVALLMNPVDRFLEKHFRLYTVKVFHCLDQIATVFPSLIQALLPGLSERLLQLEKKRGVGVDGQLRDAYYVILGRLGQIGIDEKNKLQQPDPLI